MDDHEDGGTLFVQPGSEALPRSKRRQQDKFQLFGGRSTFEFDAAKNQLIIKRRGGQERVLTKEK
jgi:hypothetical protein